ncbi:MAG TPA: CU044_2847 family protein [Waterburya sp.]|jgi:hypothetical protein
MSEVQRLLFDENGQTYEVYIESKATPTMPPPRGQGSGRESMGFQDDAVVKMQQARQMIRAYTAYALSAFKDFGAGEIEEVTLKFGIKLGGKVGIPYITEGSSESNLEIEVKCKLPNQQKQDSAQ